MVLHKGQLVDTGQKSNLGQAHSPAETNPAVERETMCSKQSVLTLCSQKEGLAACHLINNWN